MKQLEQGIEMNTIEQVGLSDGRHIVYTYRDVQKYLENLLAFIVEGIEKEQLIICVDKKEYLDDLSNRLKDMGFTENQLSEVILANSADFYAVQETFNIEQININFAELIGPYFTATRETRIWGSVVWCDQDQEQLKTRMSLHEHNYDCFVSENPNVLAVCAYDALTLPASFMNAILQTHEFHMTDTDFAPSHLYRKEPVLLTRLSEQIKLEETKENELIRSEKLDMASKIAAIAAHELGNPLGVIKGFLQLIEATDGVSDTSRVYFNTISSQVERIEQVSTEFMTLANPHLGNKKEANVAELVEEVQSWMAQQAKDKGIALKTKTTSGELTIFADPVKIKRAIMNLVKNAIEAMDGGEITIEAKDSVDHVHIEIIDNGPGISQEIINQIGDPFVTTKESGIGLGLLISKKIITGHDGKLAVKSEVGKGTTFTISFPKITE